MKTALVQALKLNKYIPQIPTAKQAAFLLLPSLEAFFGGSAGGGKSSTLLMAALQYVDVPEYAGVIFRRTYADLAKPEALMDRAHTWLGGTDARWNGQEHAWRFPSGARIVFSHLEHEASKYDHQSAAYQFCGFDELTAFTETQYRYLFSRLRRLKGFSVPLRMRGASNPGNIGHSWVRQRFIVEGSTMRRPYIPARLEDNPYLDTAAYEESLAQLDQVTRQQLRDGDWDASIAGEMFQRHWFPIVTDYPRGARMLRCWDLAGTEPSAQNTDPDWTVGALIAYAQGQYWIVDVQRFRLTPKKVEDRIAQQAAIDGTPVEILIEQEPGSSGKAVIEDFQRRVLTGYSVRGIPSTGSKLDRARPAASAAEAKNIMLVEGPWITPFLETLCLFPNGKHDDDVDVLSMGVNSLGARVTPGIYRL